MKHMEVIIDIRFKFVAKSSIDLVSSLKSINMSNQFGIEHEVLDMTVRATTAAMGRPKGSKNGRKIRKVKSPPNVTARKKTGMSVPVKERVKPVKKGVAKKGVKGKRQRSELRRRSFDLAV